MIPSIPSDWRSDAVLLAQDGTGDATTLSAALRAALDSGRNKVMVRGHVEEGRHALISRGGFDESHPLIIGGEKPDGSCVLSFGVESQEDATQDLGANGALSFQGRFNVVCDLRIQNTKYAIWMDLGHTLIKNVEIRDAWLDCIFSHQQRSEGNIGVEDWLVWRVHNRKERDSGGQLVPYWGGQHAIYLAGDTQAQPNIRITGGMAHGTTGAGVHLKSNGMVAPTVKENLFAGRSGVLLYNGIKRWLVQRNIMWCGHDQDEMIGQLGDAPPHPGRMLIVHGPADGTTRENLIAVGHARHVPLIVQGGSEPMQVSGDDWYVVDGAKCDWDNMGAGLNTPALWWSEDNVQRTNGRQFESFPVAWNEARSAEAVNSRDGLVHFARFMASVSGSGPWGPSWFRAECGTVEPPIDPPIDPPIEPPIEPDDQELAAAVYGSVDEARAAGLEVDMIGGVVHVKRPLMPTT